MIKSKVPSHSVLYAERKKQVYLGSMRFDAILDCLTTRHGDLRGKAECYCESGLYFILYAYSSKSLRAWGAVYISPGGRSSCKPPGLEHCLKLGVLPRSAQPSQHDPPTAVASSHWSIGTCQIMSWNGLSRYKRIASNFRSVAFPLSFSHAAVVKGSSLDKLNSFQVRFPGYVGSVSVSCFSDKLSFSVPGAHCTAETATGLVQVPSWVSTKNPLPNRAPAINKSAFRIRLHQRRSL